jgi:hypothetical protein
MIITAIILGLVAAMLLGWQTIQAEKAKGAAGTTTFLNILGWGLMVMSGISLLEILHVIFLVSRKPWYQFW